MSGRTGIFAGNDPFALTRAWLADATPTELADPDAIALATVDNSGLPNVRIVLLRGIEADAFVFYTNYESAKGQELIGAGKAAFVLHWKSIKTTGPGSGTGRKGRRRGGRCLLCRSTAAKPAGGLGVTSVTAIVVPRRVDGRGGQGGRDTWHQPQAPRELGRVPDPAAGNGILGGRRVPPARPLSLAACDFDRRVGCSASESLTKRSGSTNKCRKPVLFCLYASRMRRDDM